MSDNPTIEQILSDPRSADRAALDYCNAEMANCLAVVDTQADHIEGLERREALLTAVAMAEIARRMGLPRGRVDDEYAQNYVHGGLCRAADEAWDALEATGFTASGWPAGTPQDGDEE